MKKKTNRLLSILLSCVMLIGLLPTTAFAWTAPTLSGNGGDAWNIQLSAEGVLSWNDQQGATSYTIEVDETAMGVTVTKIENINGTSYNLINRFKELKLENGTYYFQIKANGPDTTSNTINFKYVSPQDKLSAPLNLSWEGTIAKWNSVANATGYTVYLYTDDGYLQLTKTTTEPQYDWTTETEDGRWFEVVATADNYRDSNAAEGPRYGTYSWTAPTLTGGEAEWNVTLSDDGMLRWNNMSSATYDIYVDETAMGGTVTNIYNINTNAFNLINRFKDLKLENGTYYFSIKANDTSATSGDISFKYVSPEAKLPAPQNLRWEGTVAKWDSVAGATEYTVTLYTSSGSVQLSKTTSETQYDWTTEAADGRWFEVVATADDYRDSNPAESPKYIVVTYSIGAYPYDATVSQTQAGGQVYLTTDEGTDGWSSDGYIKTATEGSTVTLNAMPATGYKFVEWRQGTAGAQISTSASYEFQASEAKYLYAVFEAIETTEYQIELQIFDITYTATAGGTVKVETNKGSAEGTNPKAYATKGTAVTITAVPAQGYEFVAWKKYTPHYSTAFSTEATYTFTAEEPAVIPSDDPPLFLCAVFQEVQQVVPTYEINCVAHNLSSNETGGKVFLETDKGGTGYATSQQKYATENTTVRLIAVAEPGYQFVAWRKGSPTDANANVSTNAEYQFTATEAVWMYAVFEYTPECTIDCTVFDITGGINNGQNGVGGTVSIQTDKGSVAGATPLPIKATRNSSVTVNAVAASGYEFLGWKKDSPYVQNFVATTASYTFDINEELYLYAVFQETSATNNVVITAGTGMSTTGNANQTVAQGSAITSVVYTASDGYYFPTNYFVAAQNGISVTRDSYTQITVSGTPTAAVNLTLTDATAKTQETPPSASFTATGPDTGTLSGVDSGMKYSTDGGSSWTNINSNADINLTGLSACTISVVKTGDGNTTTDSNAQSITVTKAATPNTVVGVACTTNSNDNGTLQNVTAAMEYKLSTDNSWTDGTGSVITGLTNGTYYVRVKASGTVLASDYQTVQIAAYGVSALTGTVSITGTAKYNEQLTADVSGITNNTGTLSYQWKRGSTNIGTNSSTYTLVEADIGSTITVTVSSSVETGTITSAATATVEKADGPAAPSVTPVACTNNSNNDGKITGVTTAMEYSTASDFNSKTTCTGTEITNLTNGTYYVRVAETATHKAGTAATVNVPAYSAVPTYGIDLDVNNTYSFDAVTVGYAAIVAKTVTVSNTGNSATGTLTVALSGTDAASFTLSATNIANIAVGGNDTFTVVPNTGLSAGTYTAIVTVSGGNSISASFNVSFTVNPASGGGGGGGGVTTYAITVDNTKNGTITVSPKSAVKGATVTITVKPDEGYELDTLKVVDKNGDQVKLTEKDGKYTFTMPASKITVTGTFVEIEQPMVNPFIDVKESDYFYNAVMWAVKSGVTKGTSATTFSPNAPCTRAQMVTFLWRASGSPEPATDVCPFTDVNMDSYYGKAVLWAVEKGITNGTSETTFSPEADCTRAQMAAFLCRMAGGKAASSAIDFADVSADAYYAESVQWAVENGITLGTGDGTTFSPNEICTRAQMVTFLYRFFVK